jgi:hypothetical protein
MIITLDSTSWLYILDSRLRADSETQISASIQMVATSATSQQQERQAAQDKPASAPHVLFPWEADQASIAAADAANKSEADTPPHKDQESVTSHVGSKYKVEERKGLVDGGGLGASLLVRTGPESCEE